MTIFRHCALLPVLAISCLLAACGGGSSGPSEPSGAPGTTPPPGAPGTTPPPGAPGTTPPPGALSPGGIWRFMDRAEGVQALGLVTETGEFFLAGGVGFYFGTISVSSAGVPSGTFDIFPIYAPTFDDGSPTGTGTITGGTLSARDELLVSTSFRTSRGAINTTTFTLDYDPLYERDSSLTVIAGNYEGPFMDAVTGAVINVNSNGVVFSQDPDSGCVINGTVSIINAAYNAYRVEYQYSGCGGANARLNGTIARGLAKLDILARQDYLVVGVVNAVAGYSGIAFLRRI